MAETKTKVKLPTGMADGYEVPIIEVTERWSDITLEDGTVLRVKPNVLGVTRVDNQYDPEGNPLYALKSSQIMMVTSVLPHLRKGAGSGKAN